MDAAIGDFFIDNAQLCANTGCFDQNDMPGAYEVIRVMKGQPVFVNDHLLRLQRSIGATNASFLPETIAEQIKWLIAKNHIREGNIRIEMHHANCRIFQVAHHYPTLADYKNGVPLGLLHAERENPILKVVQQGLRNAADSKIRETHCYEVLLVNSNGLITEGSRSNVFFVRNGIIITAPLDLVLNGITRQKVMSIIRRSKLDMVELAMHEQDIQACEAAFITGTSPKVLPVSRIEQYKFDPNESHVQMIMNDYNLLLEKETQHLDTN